MPLTLYWSFWRYMREKQNIKAASFCVCVCIYIYVCMYIMRVLVVHGQLGPDMCHLKQNRFKGWTSAHNKWCKYGFIRTGLVSTEPFRYIHFVCEKCHCLGHQLIMLEVSSIALQSWIFWTDYKQCFWLPTISNHVQMQHIVLSQHQHAGRWHATETLTLITVSLEFKNY
jgi:hypothetical protein